LTFIRALLEGLIEGRRRASARALGVFRAVKITAEFLVNLIQSLVVEAGLFLLWGAQKQVLRVLGQLLLNFKLLLTQLRFLYAT
jgi:hypothetical protein